MKQSKKSLVRGFAVIAVVVLVICLLGISKSNYYILEEQVPLQEAATDATGMFAHTVGADIYIGDEKFTIQGVVASNAVAASPSRYDKDMMTEDDYAEIAGLGFNTVRFLFNYNILEDDDEPYVYKQSGWDWFDMNLEWARKYGIHIILDCHLSQGGVPSTGGNQDVWTQGAPNQERLVAMWKAIAERYKDNDTILAYGLLNEPYVENGDSQAWNQLLSRLINAVRASDTNHMLMIQRAQIGENKKYLNPTVRDTNWVLEVHKYPSVEMKLVERYFVIPDDFLYYGNDSIIGYRDASNSVESNKSFIKIEQSTELSDEWQEYRFDFVAGDSNNAYLLFEILNLDEGESIEVSDVSVMCEGKEVYHMTHNLDDSYTSWSKNDTYTLHYEPSNNYIRVSGPTSYLSLADNSIFRYFAVEPGETYTVTLKARTEAGLASNAILKVTAKEYKTATLYKLNKEFTEKILDCSDLQAKYNVPIYYGEVGYLRTIYDENRRVDELSYDTLSLLKENSYNFTWFTWHEPTFGIYTSSGLEQKNNPNELLLEQIREIYN